MWLARGAAQGRAGPHPLIMRPDAAKSRGNCSGYAIELRNDRAGELRLLLRPAGGLAAAFAADSLRTQQRTALGALSTLDLLDEFRSRTQTHGFS
jgi:hypothetical protein